MHEKQSKWILADTMRNRFLQNWLGLNDGNMIISKNKIQPPDRPLKFACWTDNLIEAQTLELFPAFVAGSLKNTIF